MDIKSLLTSADKQMLNEAGQHELYASNFYKYLASCSQRNGLFGAQKFFEKEAADETEHYYLLRDFVNDMGDEIELPAIPEVDLKETGMGCLLEESYELEKELFDFYSKFYSQTKSPAVQVFLHKMVNIQRKSIGEYGDLLARFSHCVDVLIFDQELGNK